MGATVSLGEDAVPGSRGCDREGANFTQLYIASSRLAGNTVNVLSWHLEAWMGGSRLELDPGKFLCFLKLSANSVSEGGTSPEGAHP